MPSTCLGKTKVGWGKVAGQLIKVAHNGKTSVYTFHQGQVNTREGSQLNSSAQEDWDTPRGGSELREVTETGQVSISEKPT